jgi:serine/threonine-protein kinase
VGPGALVGPYGIKEEIGRGANGAVFRAARPGGPDVALKLVREPDAARALLAVAARLEPDPGLVAIVDSGEHEGAAWVATELCASSLRDRLSHGRLGAAAAAGLARALLETLARLHARGLVHGDVKPENVLFRTRDDDVPLLADVGARSIVASGVAPSWTDGPPPGTSVYASPEKLAGEPPRPEHDVFAAGVVLFEAATGARPCGPEKPGELDPGCSALDDVYARLCARADRRPDARAAAALLAPHGPSEPAALPAALRAIAPVFPGARVALGGAVVDLRGADRARAALLGPTDDGAALRVLGPAPPRAWAELLTLLPEVHVVVAAITERGAIGVVGDDAGTLARGEVVEVLLARDVHLFDRLRARRWDRTVIHDRHDPRDAGTVAASLRETLRRGGAPPADDVLRRAFELARRAPVVVAPVAPAARLRADGGIDPASVSGA